MKQKNTGWAKGLHYEKKALQFLKTQNYQIIKHRYLSPYGEIDIIGARNRLLIAFEIKARKNKDNIREAITARQKNRIEQSLLHFIAMNTEFANYDLRFDALLYTYKEVLHIPNAWEVEITD